MTRNRANLLIIGVFKSGTTSLFKFLCDHPNICGSSEKETHFFSPIVYSDGNLMEKEIAEYEKYFESCKDENYFLEATPSYLYGKDKVIDQLNKYLEDDYKVIVVIRNPTDRFISYFQYIKTRFLIDEQESFREFINKCKIEDDYSSRMEVGHHKNAFKEGIYHQFLDSWVERFNKERLKVAFFDDLIDDPKKLLKLPFYQL